MKLLPASITEAMDRSWDRRVFIEVLLITLIVLASPVINFKAILCHTSDVAARIGHSFPVTTLRPVIRIWTGRDAARAAIFFFLLFGLGVAAPLRAQMRPRWMMLFVI